MEESDHNQECEFYNFPKVLRILNLILMVSFDHFLPKETKLKVECMNWLFWQMSSAPYLGGGFGHFYSYAPEKLEYPIDRFAMETKRQLDLLNKHLENKKFICADQYTISDIAIWSWYGQLVLGRLYKADEFLDVKSYKSLIKWSKLISERPAVKKGSIVNKLSSNSKVYLRERHSKDDFKILKL